MTRATLELVSLHGVSRQGPTERERFDMPKASKQAGTYKILLGNNRVYFGSSNNLARRRNEHATALRCGFHDNPKAQRNYAKYGTFEFVVLEICDESEMRAKEQVLLDANKQNPLCVNVNTSATCSRLGLPHTPVSIQKMVDRATGRSPSLATRALISDSLKISPSAIAAREATRIKNTGRVMSDAQKLAQSRRAKGVPKSEAWKLAASKAWKTRPPATDATREKQRAARIKWWRQKRGQK